MTNPTDDDSVDEPIQFRRVGDDVIMSKEDFDWLVMRLVAAETPAKARSWWKP